MNCRNADQSGCIPQVYPDSKNNKLLEVKLEYDWTFEHGDATLVMIGLQEFSSQWSESKVLHPEASLLNTLGLYCMPTIFPPRGGDEATYGVVMANLVVHSQTLRAGTILGKLLYSVRSIPVEVEIIKTLEEVMETMTELSVNAPVQSLSTFLGPVFEPDPTELKQAIIYRATRSDVVGVHSVSLVHGPEELKFDINPELSVEQHDALKGILMIYSSVFATSLQQVGKLNAEPYTIEIQDDAKPVKVPPRMIPRDAQEWFQNYLEQLLKLGLIEPCNGPWAAGAVLVPSDADKRLPRKRNVQVMRKKHKLKLNDHQKPMAVYSLQTSEGSNGVPEEDGYDMATRPFTNEKSVEPPAFECIGANAEKQSYISSTPETSTAGKKDPYRVCMNYCTFKSLSSVKRTILF